jgi:hypothetical protein
MMSQKMFVALMVALGSGALAAQAPRERDFVVPTGTVLRVQLENAVASDSSRVEDAVRGHLVAPIVVDGSTVIPTGSPVSGIVSEAVRSGKVKGRARVGVRFNSLVADGERYRITTRQWTRVAPTTKGKDAATIALPATGGAIVGGVVGGKKGAGIGAAAGGGAGTAVVLSTRGKEVRLGRGAVLYVKLDRPLTVRVS